MEKSDIPFKSDILFKSDISFEFTIMIFENFTPLRAVIDLASSTILCRPPPEQLLQNNLHDRGEHAQKILSGKNSDAGYLPGYLKAHALCGHK